MSSQNTWSPYISLREAIAAHLLVTQSNNICQEQDKLSVINSLDVLLKSFNAYELVFSRAFAWISFQ